jgi:hypothetical protein
MIEQHKKNHIIILLLFSMSLIPFLIAWFLTLDTQWLRKGTNYGQLLTPPLTTQSSDFIGFDAFSSDNMNQLPGHWVLIHLIDSGECAEVCQSAIHKTKQLRLMMNKDLVRIRRLAIMLEPVDVQKAGLWWAEDTRLLRAYVTEAFKARLSAVQPQGFEEGELLLMDPLGNIMMRYTPGFDPYKVKSDLQKLLRISQIG